MAKDKEFRVAITKKHYRIQNFKRDELPDIVIVNKSLAEFESKEVFVWHCSVMLQ
jgi:hypothetical protein